MSKSETEPLTGTESSAEIKFSANNRLLVSGELSFKSVPVLATKSRDFFKNGDDIDVDLTGVNRADSAGVALLVDWQRQAKHQNKSIQFCNIPSQMLAIARLSGVDELLSLKS